MSDYVCPFCRTTIEDGIEPLIEHRKPGGQCDDAQLRRHPHLAEATPPPVSHAPEAGQQ